MYKSRRTGENDRLRQGRRVNRSLQQAGQVGRGETPYARPSALMFHRCENKSGLAPAPAEHRCVCAVCERGREWEDGGMEREREGAVDGEAGRQERERPARCRCNCDNMPRGISACNRRHTCTRIVRLHSTEYRCGSNYTAPAPVYVFRK